MSDSAPTRSRYDPAFRPAVEAGLLTPAKAFERGKRGVWAARLAAKHGLPLQTALAVADNRISLLEAIRLREGVVAPGAATASSRSTARRVSSSILSLALFLTLVAIGTSFALRASRTERASAVETEVRVMRTADGRVVRIDGADPASVLAAYCEHRGGGREVEALGLAEALRDRPGTRLGLLRDRAAPDETLAIYISRDRGSGRWIAGNGRSALDAFRAPEAQGALRVLDPAAP